MEELQPPEFQMVTRWTLPHLVGFLRSWSATARYVKFHGADPAVSLEGEFEALWGDTRSLEVSWPLTVRAGRL